METVVWLATTTADAIGSITGVLTAVASLLTILGTVVVAASKVVKYFRDIMVELTSQSAKIKELSARVDRFDNATRS